MILAPLSRCPHRFATARCLWVALAAAIGAAMWPAATCAQTSPKAIRRKLARDPGVQATRRAALGAAGYSRGALDDWSSRARWSHLLPEVDGEVDWLDQRDYESRYREDLEMNDTGGLLRDGARNDVIDDSRIRTIYAVELDWDLSGLVYDHSEPTIAREVRHRRQARQELLVEVGEAYYVRRRHLVEWMLTPKSDWRTRLELRLKTRRQTARLDALTGGWFTRNLSADGSNRQSSSGQRPSGRNRP